MSGVIHLLPDSVANLIKAGEVVQRPASVVKELVENAIDAGATTIKVLCQDSGRTSIQVIDDGCGMSETDARMAFERHATSKISDARDLFSIRTMGFRGEALPSIASVALVELITRRQEDELGIKLEIAASNFNRQEVVAAPVGSNFVVKNLFFNIPARRRFLKSDRAELNHVTTEFLRIALAHPNITLSLSNNGIAQHMFPAGNTKQRVSAVAGRALSKELLPIEVETTLVKITGFIGTPKTAKKSGGDQYFFANDRFMKHPYFHRAVVDAYKNLISSDVMPAYYIYLSVDTQSLDVNIHPQKTEIKFEQEQAIWQILNVAVRDCLGKYNVVPTLDFDIERSIDIPSYEPGQTPPTETFSPNVSVGSLDYNPFEHETDWDNSSDFQRAVDSSVEAIRSGANSSSYSGGSSSYSSSMNNTSKVRGWESLYASSVPVQETTAIESKLNSDYEQRTLFNVESGIVASDSSRFLQVKGKYIIVGVKSGLMVIDQHRAHERVQYDKLSEMVRESKVVAQQLLLPEVIDVSVEDACIVEEISEELKMVGLNVEYNSEAGQLLVKSIPSLIETSDVHGIIESLLYDFRNGEVNVSGGIQEYITRVLAKRSAMSYGKTLTADEMSRLYDKLFLSDSPSISPMGKTIFTIISYSDIESLLV